jgi:hypothetical protein
MAADEIHQNDIGVQFLATVKDGSAVVDISTASVKQLIFKKPSNTVVAQSGTFSTNGTDGKMYYISVSGDLDECGTWSLQGYVDINSGKWHTDIHKFQVHRNLS